MVSIKEVKAVYETAELIASKAEVMAGLDRMAVKMRAELAELDPIFLCVMNGGLIAMSELLLRLDFPLQYDYIHVSRYHGETSGSSSIHWKHEPFISLEDRVVVVVDDILDGGVTLAAIVDYCESMKSRKVYTAVMIDKPEGREANGLQKADFVGINIPNRFIFGLGLDYHNYLRNAPGIFAVADRYL